MVTVVEESCRGGVEVLVGEGGGEVVVLEAAVVGGVFAVVGGEVVVLGGAAVGAGSPVCGGALQPVARRSRPAAASTLGLAWIDM